MSEIFMNVSSVMKVMSLCMIIVVGTGMTISAQNSGLDIGDAAPEFEAMTAEGEKWSSSDHIGESILVVYFYPAAMTGGCTAQACSFRDNRSQLLDLGAEVVGISGDEVNSLRIFKHTNNLNFPLLSDPDGSIARSFGVPVRDGGTITREVDGEEVELRRTVTTSRWTYIIGRDGTVLYKDTDVDAEGDSEAVIAAIRQLSLN
jgi:thioredoxin-dependent peroxiredoxin